MVNSSRHKLCLSGWLKNNSPKEYNSSLKLQKFLFLYEALVKSFGGQPDFDRLRGYKNGAVYSDVWGDYTRDRQEFDCIADETYSDDKDTIDVVLAKKAKFIVSVLTEDELTELSHSMNIWKVKELRIKKGERQVALSENDFNDSDVRLMTLLSSLYTEEMIDNAVIYDAYYNYFVFTKQDYERVTQSQLDMLFDIACEDNELINPVFVEIDEEGRLILD